MVLEDNPVALKEVEAPLLTTVPPPNAAPAVYVVPSTGLLLRDEATLLTTTYPSAAAALNDPLIELLVTPEKPNPVGCAAGVVHGGFEVAWLPLSGLVVKYFGPPEQLLLLYANTKK